MAFQANSGGGGIPDFEIPKIPKLPKGSANVARFFIPAVILAALLLSSIYTIKPEERGIVLRLGEYRGAENDAGPGLHFKIPIVDRVYKVPVERQLKSEFGFRTETVGVRSTFSRVGDEASMLTGDLNAAMVEWVVQYRIVDAYRFLFRVRRVEETLRDMSEAVMRKVVGDRTVNEVLTVGRSEIEDQTKLSLQELCDQYETGIRIDQVVLQSINPPDAVKDSFNEVNQAEQERERLVNEAQQRANQLVPQAKGQASQAIEQSQGYALDRVNRSQGDAARFNALYLAYRKAPEVTRRRIYLETMNKVLNGAGRKMIVDDQIEGLVPMLGVDDVSTEQRAVATQQGAVN